MCVCMYVCVCVCVSSLLFLLTLIPHPSPLTQDPHNELKGQNVLIVEGSLEATAAAFSLSTTQAEQVLETSRGVLYRERQKRPRPHRDNKILTAWNGACREW